MVEENYANDYDENDVLVMAIHHHRTIEEIKTSNPNHKKIIIYQLEPLSKNHWWNEEFIVSRIKDADEVWDYDLDNIEVLKKYGIEAKFKPFVYAESLKRVQNKQNPDIDVFFYGTPTEYRSKILETISNCAVFGKDSSSVPCVVTGFNLTKQSLDEFISRSKIIIDLQDNNLLQKSPDEFVQKQSRIYYALINNKCIISEKSKRNYYGDLIIEAEKEDLLNKIIYLLNEDRWKNYSTVSDGFKNLSINNIKQKRTLMESNSTEEIMTLSDIVEKYDINGNDKDGGTDKNSVHSYFEVYDEILSPYKNKKGSILEIGVYCGGSLILWSEYFKDFKVCGLDVCDNMSDKVKSNLDPNKVNCFLLDAYNSDSLSFVRQHYDEDFDVIIDDGPHTLESQSKCIELYLNVLKPNGTLIIEDVDNLGYIPTLISKLPSSDIFDYEYSTYDLTEKKGRWDDILFVVKKVYKKISSDIMQNNLLHANKETQENHRNICMISMFKNESKGIRRMLESVYKHIDFYIFQDNGSTDGTPDIVEEFFADKNIPGFIYKIEEGWVGFGWNRDHLLQTCLKSNHGCDWIMKMDCDEYLEIDEDFDWSYFDNTDTQSFHVTAQNPGCIYYRAWIWNAKLPWKFHHDVAHECIYIDNEIGEGFERVDLPRSFRMIGTNDGESYSVRTKYISDALKIEEKLIREETMLTDTYHFWYIAKSYQDCFQENFYPLGEEHSKEFARRFIFYFEQYLNYVNCQGINEMCYFSAFSIGLGYKYLGEIEKAIDWLNDAEKYCPVRNEHIVYLAETYSQLGQYEKMLEQTTRLIQPDRKLPFPDYYFLVNTNLYQDSGTYPQELHNYALSKIAEGKTINSFSVSIQTKPRLWIIDNFYDDPYAVREFALQQEFQTNLDYYKGSRSKQQFIVPGTKEAFEKIIGKKITNWTETHGMCGRFQYCTAEDDLVYHCDSQTLAGMIYLTPDAPHSCGTSLFAHKRTGLRNENDFGDVNVFGETGFYDKTKFELVDTAGNVFNRLVLFDAKCIHSANEYFGTDLTNSRLFHLFFFD
jgi:tetratricopeptide (TPR) repeat protein